LEGVGDLATGVDEADDVVERGDIRTFLEDDETNFIECVFLMAA
jgi:hypothetical protein